MRLWVVLLLPVILGAQAPDAAERLIARRNQRLTLLPAAPAIPAGAAAHPIDRFIQAKWKTAALPRLTDDVAFLRRVYLDLIGRIPTMQEAQAFLAKPDRIALIDDLLARNDDYAAHWTSFWEDAIGSSSNPGVTGGISNRGNYQRFLFRMMRENQPYDVMAASLIDPAMPRYQKPTVNDANTRKVTNAYIRNEDHTETIQSAANVAQTFMGTGMKCASCHSHFTNLEWTQKRFLGFAGMFAARDLELIRCERKSGQFVPARFPFDIPGAVDAVPSELNGRLARAAELLTDPLNPRFAKTIVNRLWKRYLGLGLFEPADDFRLDTPPSHPELLDWLADDFMRHGYDLKHTVRLILTSRTYQHRYDATLEDHFDVSRPELPRYFRSPALRRMTAEQFLDSVTTATWQRLDPQRRAYLDKTTTALSRALGRPAARTEITTWRSQDLAIVQSLEMLNGEELQHLLHGGTLLAEGNPDTLYRAVLSRIPTAKERAAAEAYLRASPTPARAGDPAERVWIGGESPPGALLNVAGKDGTWPWELRDGHRVRRITGAEGTVRHSLREAPDELRIGPRDTLFADVFIDPANPPKMLTMAWNRGGGFEGRTSPALPEPGKWVRLKIPVEATGMRVDTRGISGWQFEQQGGTVYWGAAGVLEAPPEPATEPYRDLLWALFTSPEFLYLR